MAHYEFVTTEWARVEMSEATANHLGLTDGAVFEKDGLWIMAPNPYQVWSRMVDGVINFLVLQSGEEPLPDAEGWYNLPSALAAKGCR